MIARAKLLGCFVAGLAFCTGANAISADNPYQSVIDRNVFGLRAPPPPPDPEANKPAPPKLTLQGIMTGFGKPRVMFKAQLPPKPPEPPKDQSFVLSPGERDGQIEVLEIDDKLGSIKFNNYGTVQTL